LQEKAGSPASKISIRSPGKVRPFRICFLLNPCGFAEGFLEPSGLFFHLPKRFMQGFGFRLRFLGPFPLQSGGKDRRRRDKGKYQKGN
jgi:hypothetical protein